MSRGSEAARRSLRKAAEASGAPELGEREFERYRHFIYHRTGIHLGPAKKVLVEGRLQKRLRQLGMASFAAYLDLALADADETARLLDAITTNETRFFREAAHFTLIESALAPAWREAAEQGRRPRRLRAWSAGCSSGEEPYSLAMTLLASLPPHEGWQVEILATDISTKVLAQAEAATWPITRAAEIPPRYLKAYMLRGIADQEGRMKAGPELRAVVYPGRLNLCAPPYPLPGGKIDLILCRNVMIYFDAASRRCAVESMLDHLADDGYFFVGHAESMSGVTDRLRSVAPMVYQLRQPGGKER